MPAAANSDVSSNGSAWFENWYYAGYTFAITAFAWAALLSMRAIYFRAPSEIIHSIAQAMWLFGNMWPLGVYNDRDNALVKMYNDVTPPLQPRFRFYFTDWRFLHGHILVEHAHYWAYLIWVLGNMIWAMGDEYFAESAVEQQDMWHDPYHWQTMRWWASWTFLMAFVPLIILYVVWIPCSITGKHIGEPQAKEVNKEVPVADDDVTATQQKAALSTPPSAEPLEQA
ncbi:hypothetical protein JKP88DRAFT_267272 [Tribonema minus]|uniref:Uncharacterized protein n=1 Tax=Tribonema minus TaxID=303371 RepID=A0A835ZAF0_9STRA|nr:hypothetical protein JKP88DRAFT_267272 [Tribonema minus]